MNGFELIFLNIILIVFPFTICLLYQTYNINYMRKENDLYMKIAIITSFYFNYKFGISDKYMAVLLLNIPLLVAYKNNYRLISIIISFFIIKYYYYNFNIPIYFSVLEYAIYYLIYSITYKTNTYKDYFFNSFMILKIIVVSFYFYINKVYILAYNSILIAIIHFLVFYILTYLMMLLIRKTEEMILFHNSLNTIENEKKIRTTLFQITHEIKNPIAVCKGYLDMFDIDNKNHSKKYVPILKKEISKVLILLEDFLSITKIKIEKENMSVNELLTETKSMLIPLFKNQKIKYKFDIPNYAIYINADYNRINQVLINIIKNSIEAMENSKNKKINIILHEENSVIDIIIEDTGCGMNEESLCKIATPFYTTKKNGTGLGTYLCDEVIKAHNGKIIYKSQVGKGTKIIIKLPKKKDVKIS